MKMLTFRYPLNAVTDILLCLLCVFCIILVFQVDSNHKIADAFADSDNVVGFIESYGWKVDASSEEISSAMMPAEQNDVFVLYNKLQLEQGFDLVPYLGKVLTKYTYLLRQNPVGSKEVFYATVLTYDGKIVGADIYSPSINGFMQGVVIG